MQQQEVAVNVLVKTFIKRSCKKPSQNFGRLVLEVDHALLGGMARQHRTKAGVKAVRVAEQVSLPKKSLNYLEFGRKCWTIDLLTSYLQAVHELKGNGNCE